jgi:hypothetical protein
LFWRGVRLLGRHVDAKNAARRKQRSRPPWGDILRKDAIERNVWGFKTKLARNELQLKEMQYSKMLRLKRHYGIFGGEYDYPIKGVANADWLPWYDLALAIASELDESLRIVDNAAPLGKTAPRWRGFDGLVLLNLVDAHRTAFPRRPLRWSLEQVRKRTPELRQLPLEQLEVRYYEAKRHHRVTKQPHKNKPAS